MTGPSTNFYVGARGTHHTIPKRLLYHFSEYAQPCLEGNFLEASTNAVWLPDVDLDVFRWLWRWLYSGELDVHGHYQSQYTLDQDEKLRQACEVLCRVHFLGERLLFDSRILEYGVRMQLEAVLEEAKLSERAIPLTPQIVAEVLSDSAPVRYGDAVSWQCNSLRPFVLENLSTFQFCTTVDFMDFADCFELDGAFAAELMRFLASELEWARARWETKTGWPVDVTEKRMERAEYEGYSQWVAIRPNPCPGELIALRYICTFAGCQTTDFRAYSQCFERDGEVAAEILNYMAEELLWIVEAWGIEMGEVVDFAAEKAEEARIAEEESTNQHMLDKIMQRGGWW